MERRYKRSLRSITRMSTYQPQNILVTGGAGFIGSHFVDHMLQSDKTIQVINLDALTYAGKMENLELSINDPRHHFVHGNICDKELVSKLFAQYSIDTVVHFAAESHVDRSILRPEIFVKTNIEGTQCLLEVARKVWLEQNQWDREQCRFHMISTDEVFGSLQLDEPAFTEKSSYQPNSPYAASKAGADHLVRAYNHTYKLPVTISNCSNNYGPRQDNEKLIPTVIQACFQQKAIPVYGNGLNRRDWIHVIDHCRMVDWVIRNGVIGDSYNLGADCERTNIEVIQWICASMDELLPQEKPHAELIRFVHDRAGHDFRYAINSNKALKEGCVKPIYDFKNTLKQMIKSRIA